MDKTDIINNNVEELEEEKVEQEVVATPSDDEETNAETEETTVSSEEETTEVASEEAKTEEVSERENKQPRAPRRGYRQPNFRSRQFGWESLDTVQDERKEELIQEVFSLKGDDNEEKIEEIQEEWEQLHEEGSDKRIERRFERAIERHTATKEAIDEAIKVKSDLLARAEEMRESTRWNKTADKYKKLQKDWREAGWAGEPDNDELWAKFQEVNDYFFNRRKEHFARRAEKIEEAAVIKAELVEEAIKYEDSSDWKDTSAIMHGLMDKWKAAGFAGRNVDDELWEKFNGARQKFFQRQNEHFENLRRRQRESYDIKKDLIAQAEANKDSTDFENTRVKMEELMDQWREAGYSGRKHDNQLWEEFQAARDVFYKNFHSQRNVNTASRREEIEIELENVNAQIDSLELLNETIIAKYDSVLSRALPSEDNDKYEELHEAKEAELAELQGYINNNNESINDHFDTLDRLNNELDKINRR